jgi:hypothetical protein
LYHTQPIGRGKPVGSLVVLGQHLVYVTPANSNILKNLAPELIKKKCYYPDPPNPNKSIFVIASTLA